MIRDLLAMAVLPPTGDARQPVPVTPDPAFAQVLAELTMSGLSGPWPAQIAPAAPVPAGRRPDDPAAFGPADRADTSTAAPDALIARDPSPEDYAGEPVWAVGDELSDVDPLPETDHPTRLADTAVDLPPETALARPDVAAEDGFDRGVGLRLSNLPTGRDLAVGAISAESVASPQTGGVLHQNGRPDGPVAATTPRNGTARQGDLRLGGDRAFIPPVTGPQPGHPTEMQVAGEGGPTTIPRMGVDGPPPVTGPQTTGATAAAEPDRKDSVEGLANSRRASWDAGAVFMGRPDTRPIADQTHRRAEPLPVAPAPRMVAPSTVLSGPGLTQGQPGAAAVPPTLQTTPAPAPDGPTADPQAQRLPFVRAASAEGETTVGQRPAGHQVQPATIAVDPGRPRPLAGPVTLDKPAFIATAPRPGDGPTAQPQSALPLSGVEADLNRASPPMPSPRDPRAMLTPSGPSGSPLEPPAPMPRAGHHLPGARRTGDGNSVQPISPTVHRPTRADIRPDPPVATAPQPVRQSFNVRYEPDDILAETPVPIANGGPPGLSVGPEAAAPTPGRAAPPDPARLMHQVLTAAAAGQSTDVRLDPADLGQMRLHVTASDDKVSILLTADRADTADLFRRHAGELAQELRAMGYASVSFSFGQGPGSGQNFAPDRQSAALTTGSDPESLPNPPPARLPTGGLDLRL